MHWLPESGVSGVARLLSGSFRWYKRGVPGGVRSLRNVFVIFGVCAGLAFGLAGDPYAAEPLDPSVEVNMSVLDGYVPPPMFGTPERPSLSRPVSPRGERTLTAPALRVPPASVKPLPRFPVTQTTRTNALNPGIRPLESQEFFPGTVEVEKPAPTIPASVFPVPVPPLKPGFRNPPIPPQRPDALLARMDPPLPPEVPDALLEKRRQAVAPVVVSVPSSKSTPVPESVAASPKAPESSEPVGKSWVVARSQARDVPSMPAVRKPNVSAETLEVPPPPKPVNITAPLLRVDRDGGGSVLSRLETPTVEEIANILEKERGKRTSAPAKKSALPTPGVDLVIPFEAGAPDLPGQAADAINQKIVEALKQNESARVQIIAYATPADEGQSSARRLSLSRALGVRGYLMENGVEPQRIDVRARGANTAQKPFDRVDLVLFNPRRENNN